MNQEKAINILTISNLLLLPVVVIMSFYLEAYLPPQLFEYLNHEWERESTIMELIIGFGAIPVIIFHVMALFGVLFLKSWARKMLLVSSIAIYLITPFLGPHVEHEIPAILDSLATLLLGALLALLYFGNSVFNQPK